MRTLASILHDKESTGELSVKVCHDLTFNCSILVLSREKTLRLQDPSGEVREKSTTIQKVSGFWIYFKHKAVRFAMGLIGGRKRNRDIKDDPKFLTLATRRMMLMLIDR